MSFTLREPSRVRKGLPTVRDIMETDVLTLNPELPLLDAIDFLLQHNISGAPVVSSEDGSLVGILSEKDCLNVVSKGAAKDAHDRPTGVVADYMSSSVVTVPPRMDIYYAAGLFLAEVFHRFPVVDRGMLVGLVSRRDVLQAVRDNLG